MEDIVYNDYSLKSFNTYGIGGKAKRIVIPESIDTLVSLLKDLEKSNTSYYILGNGSNVILPDENYNGVVIVTKKLNKYHIDGDRVTIDAGVMLPYINQELLKLGYTNFLWASGIPGTIGGSIKGNAGAYGHTIGENLESIMVYKNHDIIELPVSDIKFSYRESDIEGIILSAKYRLVKESEDEIQKLNEKLSNRVHTQPIGAKSAGSVFRNPANDSAGRLIDGLGLKGYHIGDAMVSDIHANFIVNSGNATSDDIKRLIKEIHNKVKEVYNIDLILEQKIVEWD